MLLLVVDADAGPAFQDALLDGYHRLLRRRDALDRAHTRHVVAVRAAQQLVDGNAEVLPFDVVQGDVDGGDGGRQRAPTLRYTAQQSTAVGSQHSSALSSQLSALSTEHAARSTHHAQQVWLAKFESGNT